LRDKLFNEIYNFKWSAEMKALLKKAIALKKRMKPEQNLNPFEERDSILFDFDILFKENLLKSALKYYLLSKDY
jgi:hypothetical protein